MRLMIMYNRKKLRAIRLTIIGYRRYLHSYCGRTCLLIRHNRKTLRAIRLTTINFRLTDQRFPLVV